MAISTWQMILGSIFKPYGAVLQYQAQNELMDLQKKEVEAGLKMQELKLNALAKLPEELQTYVAAGISPRDAMMANPQKLADMMARMQPGMGGQPAPQMPGQQPAAQPPPPTGQAPQGETLGQLVERISQQEGIHPQLAHSLVQTESGWNPRATSPKGAKGLTQLMPGTAKGLGVVDAYNPEQNVNGGMRYLRQQIERFRDVDKALAAYNAGPEAVDKYGGVPPYKETQAFVSDVKSRIDPAVIGSIPSLGSRPSQPVAQIPGVSALGAGVTAAQSDQSGVPQPDGSVRGDISAQLTRNSAYVAMWKYWFGTEPAKVQYVKDGSGNIYVMDDYGNKLSYIPGRKLHKVEAVSQDGTTWDGWVKDPSTWPQEELGGGAQGAQAAPQATQQAQQGQPPAGMIQPMIKKPGGTRMTPGAIDSAARHSIRTGQTPSIGFGTSAAEAKIQIQNRRAEIAQQEGITPDEMALSQAEYAAAKATLADQEKRRSQIMGFIKTTTENLEVVKEASRKVDRTGIPILNKWVNAARRDLTNDPDLLVLDAAVKTAVDEYAKVLSSASGGGVTSDSARHEAQQLLGSAHTPEQVEAVASFMITEMENRYKGFQQEIERAKDIITRKPQGETSETKHGGSIKTAEDYLKKMGAK